MLLRGADPGRLVTDTRMETGMKTMLVTLVCALGCGAQQPKTVYRWDPQKSGVDDDLLGVCFVDRQTGFAVGKANTMIKTTDGGNTWNRLMERRDGTDFRSVAFSSPADGWVAGGPLLHTADGGESWQPAVPLPDGGGFGGGALLGSARLQMKVHNLGVGVFRSDDGGRSWKSLTT